MGQVPSMQEQLLHSLNVTLFTKVCSINGITAAATHETSDSITIYYVNNSKISKIHADFRFALLSKAPFCIKGAGIWRK